MRSKKALKNITVLIMLQIVAILCGFIVPKIIISKFGSDVNGLITSITQFLSYITLMDLGIGAVVKSKLYEPISKNDIGEISNILYIANKFFKRIALFFLCYVIILAFLYPIIVNDAFDYAFTFCMIIIVAISSFCEYYFGITYRLYLQADQKTYIISLIQMFTILLNVIVVVILAKFDTNILLLKFLSTLVYALRPLLQNFYVKKYYNISFKNVDKKYQIDQKWDGMAQHIASFVHTNTDVAVLTFFTNVYEVSVYAVYSLVVSGLRRLVESISNGVASSFGDMIAKKENEILNNSFSFYEYLYNTIITTIYICTLILIIPFVKIYTFGVKDVNYIRPTFATLIVIAEFIHSMRIPYNSLVLVAGRFKETKNGAWFEAIVNIIISVLLVFKLGIIGVAIGTCIAMGIRAIEFINYSSDNILYRKKRIVYRNIIIIIIQTIGCLFIGMRLTKLFEKYIINYFSLLKFATLIFGMVSIIVFITNTMIHFKEFKKLTRYINKLMKGLKNAKKSSHI